jgi:hypothetical protein
MATISSPRSTARISSKPDISDKSSCESKFTFSKLDHEIYLHNDYMKYVKETLSHATYHTELEQELFYCKEWLRINPSILRESSKMRKRTREIINYTKPLLDSIRIKFNDLAKHYRVLLDKYYRRNDGDETELNDIESSRNDASELIRMVEKQLQAVSYILGRSY